ncbi:RNA polymerase sigma factor [Desulfuribacillus alkaliarsenatis]|uniref:RNA polymerase subunit sigma-24 n=1 Tax=Desulfuribacillus alkaliarsenatis TaxID=766136 RepID=A0A1E5FYP2_9FIRM|nr:RNA polymerase sigma factor [Desulfuribacillus alkaliarsenatis]OEF95692.1 RNA polymerase subunit sigma-24 [Desulfuribacillus alkaliarsenatis]
MDIADLVKQAKKGNKEALLTLIMSEKDAYYRLALTYMHNPNDAMDALEDMIVKLYENINQLKQDSSFYSWSKTVLVNHCKNLLRKKNKVVLIDDWDDSLELNSNSNFIDNSYTSIENQMDIKKMLSYLNNDQREAIKLKYFHDLDYQLIADLTNVPIGTVKSRIFQGLKKLKEQFGGA